MTLLPYLLKIYILYILSENEKKTQLDKPSTLYISLILNHNRLVYIEHGILLCVWILSCSWLKNIEGQ